MNRFSLIDNSKRMPPQKKLKEIMHLKTRMALSPATSLNAIMMSMPISVMQLIKFGASYL